MDKLNLFVEFVTEQVEFVHGQNGFVQGQDELDR